MVCQTIRTCILGLKTIQCLTNCSILKSMALTERQAGEKIRELQGDVIHFLGISKESSSSDPSR